MEELQFAQQAELFLLVDAIVLRAQLQYAHVSPQQGSGPRLRGGGIASAAPWRDQTFSEVPSDLRRSVWISSGSSEHI